MSSKESWFPHFAVGMTLGVLGYMRVSRRREPGSLTTKEMENVQNFKKSYNSWETLYQAPPRPSLK